MNSSTSSNSSSPISSSVTDSIICLRLSTTLSECSAVRSTFASSNISISFEMTSWKKGTKDFAESNTSLIFDSTVGSNSSLILPPSRTLSTKLWNSTAAETSQSDPAPDPESSIDPTSRSHCLLLNLM